MIIELLFLKLLFSLKIKLILHIIDKDKINTMEMEKHFLNVFMAKIRDDFILSVHIFYSVTTKILGRDKESWSTHMLT